MKRIFAMFLCLLMALSLVACGNGGASDTSNQQGENVETAGVSGDSSKGTNNNSELNTYVISGADYQVDNVMISFPADYTINYYSSGSLKNITNSRVEITYGHVSGTGYSSADEYAEGLAEGLRNNGPDSIEVRHGNDVCYIYKPDNGEASSGMLIAYYYLGEQILQLEARLTDMEADLEEVVAIVTSGVIGYKDDTEYDQESTDTSAWINYTHTCGLTISYPSDYTIQEYEDGSLNRIKKGEDGAVKVEMLAYVRYQGYETVDAEAEEYAATLRNKGIDAEVRYENNVCYIYAADGDGYTSGTIYAYYGLGEQAELGEHSCLVTVKVSNLNLDGEEAISIATSGVIG